MQRFWQWLARIAVRRATRPRMLAGPPPIPVGMPGHRDPEAVCKFYTPKWMHDPAFMEATGPGACATDGHYLCDECIWQHKE